MDTTTRRTEAMQLLALDELTGGQADKLSILTAQQVGYSVRKTRTIPNPAGDIDAYGLFLNGEHIAGDDAFEGNLWAETPDYANSVDACLSLPKPRGYFWELFSPTEGDENDSAGANLIDHIDIEQGWQHSAKTLPIAMLKARWTLWG